LKQADQLVTVWRWLDDKVMINIAKMHVDQSFVGREIPRRFYLPAEVFCAR
jgi:hypothetical protein